MSDVAEAKQILAIHAHPDDIEIQCAGTLALLKERGHRITLVTMTPGNCGSAEHDEEEISRIRRAEARKSAELLGADYMCLEFRDLSIDFDPASRRVVTECFRKVRPDLVITAPPVDYMADHEVTSRLAQAAGFNASVPNYKTLQWDPAPPTDHPPHLYYVDAMGHIDYFGKPLPPQFIVDINRTMELKLEMLACHASQRDWLRKQHGLDEYLDSCRRYSSQRGQEIGTTYGEGFCQHLGHPFPADNLLLELLGK